HCANFTSTKIRPTLSCNCSNIWAVNNFARPFVGPDIWPTYKFFIWAATVPAGRGGGLRKGLRRRKEQPTRRRRRRRRGDLRGTTVPAGWRRRILGGDKSSRRGEGESPSRSWRKTAKGCCWEYVC
uniref:Uncharacterized protein n=1 Tax=Oryza punctata TaxID=4537 RepID=A0A0E0LLV0_ORYPU